MAKHLLFLITIALSLQSYAQIDFEKGYFINDSGERIDCLIRNMDWSSSPSEFTYKLSENEKTERATINSVREFTIFNTSKYIRRTVDIDKSSEVFSYLTYNKNPVFEDEQLFLRVLIEGKASLYEYSNSGLKRFFYSIDDSDIEQLVYKSYLVERDKVGKNNMYKQQLHNTLKCSTFTDGKLENLKYGENELSRFFIDYNVCNDEKYTDFRETKKRWPIHISIRPGLNSSSLKMKNEVLASRNAEFDKNVSFRIGIELEYVLPFNKNKWALIMEPTYQYYESETTTDYQTVSIDYKSIELPLGVRHYLFLSPKSKIFLNASVVFDFSSSYMQFSYSPPELPIRAGNNLAFGFGYKYSDRFSLELRYLTDRDLLQNHVHYSTEYKTMSVIFGYTLF